MSNKYYIFNELANQQISSMYNGLLNYITNVMYSGQRFKTKVVSPYNKAVQLLTQQNTNLTQEQNLVPYYPAICVDPTFPIALAEPEGTQFFRYQLASQWNVFLYNAIYENDSIRVFPGYNRIISNVTVIAWLDSFFEYTDVQLRFIQTFNGINRPIRLFTLTAQNPLPVSLTTFNQDNVVLDWTQFSELQIYDPQGRQIPTIPVVIQPYMKIKDIGDGSEKYGSENIAQFRISFDIEIEYDILIAFIVETNYKITSISLSILPYPISQLSTTEESSSQISTSPWAPNIPVNQGQILTNTVQQMCLCQDSVCCLATLVNIPFTWAKNTYVSLGETVTIGDNVYISTIAGKTGSTQPNWNSLLPVINDGSVVWTLRPLSCLDNSIWVTPELVTWEPNGNIVQGNYIDVNGVCYIALTSGTSGDTEPVWNTSIVQDGSVTWQQINCSNLNAIDLDLNNLQCLQMYNIVNAYLALTSGQTGNNLQTGLLPLGLLNTILTSIQVGKQTLMFSNSFCGYTSPQNSVIIILKPNTPVNLSDYFQTYSKWFLFANGSILSPTQYTIYNGIVTILTNQQAYIIFTQ
ncbi:MAG: hypothetical protein QXP36_02055 [Conexivisphaerales archaeon]